VSESSSEDGYEQGGPGTTNPIGLDFTGTVSAEGGAGTTMSIFIQIGSGPPPPGYSKANLPTLANATVSEDMQWPPDPPFTVTIWTKS
jgi:hypothetical protein